MKTLKTEYSFSDDRLHGMRRRRISGEKLPKRLAAESVRYDGEKTPKAGVSTPPKKYVSAACASFRENDGCSLIGKAAVPPAAEDGTTGKRAARREALNSRGGTPKKDASPPPPGCGTMLQNAGRSDHGLTPASPCFYSPPADASRHARQTCRKKA